MFPSLFFFRSELLSCILDRHRWVTMEEIDAAATYRRRSCKLGDNEHEVHRWVKVEIGTAGKDDGFPWLGSSRVLGEDLG